MPTFTRLTNLAIFGVQSLRMNAKSLPSAYPAKKCERLPGSAPGAATAFAGSTGARGSACDVEDVEDKGDVGDAAPPTAGNALLGVGAPRGGDDSCAGAIAEAWHPASSAAAT
jgi:hypothetical protein